MAMARRKKPTVGELDEKFEKTAFQLNQERSDFLLPQIIDFVKGNKWLNLRPEYQRRLVWDKAKKSRFIESLLLNVPVPPVFLYEWDLSRYEVMDGQQRLNAIVEFYENRFSLSGMEEWKELAGFTYGQLPSTLQRGLDRRRISATVLLVERRDRAVQDQRDIRKLVFNRLNTGGQQLNAQELRNCLFDGPLNKLLIALSQEPEFQSAWDIPLSEDYIDAQGTVLEPLASNGLFKRMVDCEIVLRFFAFRQRKKLKGSVRLILDTFMEDRIDLAKEKVEALAELHRTRLALCREIFGAHVFRHKDENGRWRLSQPLYDAEMVAVDRLWENRRELVRRKAKIKMALCHLLQNDDAYEVVVGKPNTAKAIEERLRLVEDTFTEALAE